MKKINKSEEFLDRLRKENKVEVFPIKADSKFLEQVKRDFLKKGF